MRLFKSDFTQGLMWNYASIFFLAVGGVFFSFLIGCYYDAGTLGEFNLVYSFYIVFSQIGVWGSHMAVTKYISENAANKETSQDILVCALIVTAAISVTSGSIVWIICNFVIVHRFTHSLLGQVNSVLAAVFFFSMNKVILGYLNGMSRMKEYAVFQALRNILIAVWILIFATLSVPGSRICNSFLYTEVLLFLIGIFRVLMNVGKRPSLSLEWIKKIINFGTKIMPANLVLELNTKIDVFCLWLVLGEGETLGIYSFAALFAEGFCQLFVVIRRSINPIITQSSIRGELKEFYLKMVRGIRKWGYLSAFVCCVFIVICYRILCFYMKDAGYYAGTSCLLIMLTAILLNMKSIIFGNILSQTGYPAAESVNNVITVLTNFVLNILLILKMGMIGAALATGISYFAFSMYQKIMVKKNLNLL